MSEIKVGYTTKSGYTSKAYVDEYTLEGTDKHTDFPVKLVRTWKGGELEYVDVEEREFEENPYTGNITEKK